MGGSVDNPDAQRLSLRWCQWGVSHDARVRRLVHCEEAWSGYDTFVVRELEKRDDERDRAASQRAWALTGVVGFFGGIVATAVGAFGGPMTPALAVVLWLQLISLIGGNIYFNRTM